MGVPRGCLAGVEGAGAPGAEEMAAANMCTGLFGGSSIFTLDMKTEKANLLNHVSDYKGWKEVEITVDSGACDPVMPVHCCSNVQVVESDAKTCQVGVRCCQRPDHPQRGRETLSSYDGGCEDAEEDDVSSCGCA